MERVAFTESSLAGIPVRRGKVRDVYDFGDSLLIVAPVIWLLLFLFIPVR